MFKMTLAILVISLLFLLIGKSTQSHKSSNKADNEEEFIPHWAKTVVWYQIFSERFRDGDNNNNPNVTNIIGADPQEAPKTWQIHPWGSDWYKLQDYEKANG